MEGISRMENNIPVPKPKISYEECEEIVQAYRSTKNDADSQRLIDAFEGYIVKFYNLIRWGRVAIADRDVREFLKLYMKNEYTRKHIHQYYHMAAVRHEIYSVAESIKNLLKTYENEELKNEIYTAFLTMANRYKSPDGKPRFHDYILKAFHYQLRRQLQTLVEDPVVFNIVQNINFHEEYGYDFHDDMSTIDGYQDMTATYTIEEKMEEFNDNWILGYTADENYKNLSVMERKIIKMYYLDEMSDQDIADGLGICRATVNRRRNKAVKTLSVVFGHVKRIHVKRRKDDDNEDAREAN
jgi:RNA polymerase sigma factor (sigma-70 family)